MWRKLKEDSATCARWVVIAEASGGRKKFFPKNGGLFHVAPDKTARCDAAASLNHRHGAPLASVRRLPSHAIIPSHSHPIAHHQPSSFPLSFFISRQVLRAADCRRADAHLAPAVQMQIFHRLLRPRRLRRRLVRVRARLDGSRLPLRQLSGGHARTPAARRRVARALQRQRSVPRRPLLVHRGLYWRRLLDAERSERSFWRAVKAVLRPRRSPSAAQPLPLRRGLRRRELRERHVPGALLRPRRVRARHV